MKQNYLRKVISNVNNTTTVKPHDEKVSIKRKKEHLNAFFYISNYYLLGKIITLKALFEF